MCHMHSKTWRVNCNNFQARDPHLWTNDRLPLEVWLAKCLLYYTLLTCGHREKNARVIIRWRADGNLFSTEEPCMFNQLEHHVNRQIGPRLTRLNTNSSINYWKCGQHKCLGRLRGAYVFRIYNCNINYHSCTAYNTPTERGYVIQAYSSNKMEYSQMLRTGLRVLVAIRFSRIIGVLVLLRWICYLFIF